MTISQLASSVDALIVTKGSQGSSIYSKDEEIVIDAIPIKIPVDPTGCGDAYRAGLIYGILNKYDWAKTGQLASVMGAIKIESQGGQNHTATLSEIESLLGSSLT